MARATPLHRYYHSPGGLPSCVTPSLAYYHSGSRASPAPLHKGARRRRAVSIGGVSMGVPSRGRGNQTPVHRLRPSGPPLGPAPPWADSPAPGPLVLPGGGFLPPLSLLIPAFSPAWRPRLDPPPASPATRRSPTHPHPWPPTTVGDGDTWECHGFGGVL